MKLLAILVNYRTAEMTWQAVLALLRELENVPGAEVVVIDNDSQDGSFDTLIRLAKRHASPCPVEIIASDTNGGFGAGVNIGVRYGLAAKEPPDYFYLLNSDAFPDSGAVVELLRVLEREPRAGIAGSYIHGLDGVPHPTAFRFPNPLSELEAGLKLGIATKLLSRWRVVLPVPDSDREVDWVAGASMMIRRSVFEQIGGFDETFFLYFEETDFCRRAKLAGYSVHYAKKSSVAHVGGASTGIQDNRQTSRRPMPRYWFDSRHYYFKKNHGPVYAALSDACFVFGFSAWRLRRRIQGKPDQDPPQLLFDFIGHSATQQWRRPAEPPKIALL